MTTKERDSNKICCFCASDFHLEMILLPYIKEKFDEAKFIIITENDLEESIKVLLSKVNVEEKFKKEVLKLDWKGHEKDKFELIKKYLQENKKINIIINGEYEFIKRKNNEIKNIINDKINIIDCFHVGDVNIDIDSISRDYKYILNTKRM